MIRYAGLIVLFGLAGLATVYSQAPTAPRSTTPNRLYEGDTLKLRSEGRPERNVKVLKITHFPDGESLADLQDQETGAKYSVSAKVLVNMAKNAIIVPGSRVDKLPLPSVPPLPGESPRSTATTVQPLSPLTSVAQAQSLNGQPLPRGKKRPDPLPLKPESPEPGPLPMVTLPPLQKSQPPTVPQAVPVPPLAPAVPMPMPSAVTPPKPSSLPRVELPPAVPKTIVPPPPTPTPPQLLPLPLPSVPLPSGGTVSPSVAKPAPAEYATDIERAVAQVPVYLPEPVQKPEGKLPPGEVEIKSSATYPAQMPMKPCAPEIPEPRPDLVLPARVRLKLPSSSLVAEQLAREAITVDRTSKYAPPVWPTEPSEQGIRLELPKASRIAEELAKKPLIVDHSSRLQPPVWKNSPTEIAPRPKPKSIVVEPMKPVVVEPVKPKPESVQPKPVEHTWVIPPAQDVEDVPQQPKLTTVTPEVARPAVNSPPIIPTVVVPQETRPVPAAGPKLSPIPEPTVPDTTMPGVSIPVVKSREVSNTVAKLVAPQFKAMETQKSATSKRAEEAQAKRESLAATLGNHQPLPAPPTPAPWNQVPNRNNWAVIDVVGQETGEFVKDLFGAMRPSLRERAASGLAACRHNWRPEIKGLIAKAAVRDPAPTVRAHCIGLLAKLGYTDAAYLRALEYLAATDEPIVKQAAETSLDKFLPSR